MNAAAEAKYPMAVDKLPPKDKTVPIQPAVWLGHYLGIVDMPNTPRVWGWNPSVITLLILIAGLLTGGGYYVGHQAAIIENIKKQADDARQDAKNAKDIAIAGQVEATATSTPTRR